MSEDPDQLTTALAVAGRLPVVGGAEPPAGGPFGVAIAACALTRAEAVLFVGILIIPLMLFDRRLDWRRRLVQAGLSAVVAGLVIAPGSATTCPASSSRSPSPLASTRPLPCPTATPPTTDR